jgi:hypothetical protein
VGLWTSADGRVWTEQPAGLGLSLAGAAEADGRWWLATSEGLIAAGGEAPAAAQAPRPAGRAAHRPPAAPAWWAAVLPRVTVAAGGRRQADARGEWHVWVVLTLPLGRRLARERW